MKLALHLAFALLMTAMPSNGRAADVLDAEAQRVAARFVKLAGSGDNAVALALALHHGVPVQIVAARDDDALPDAITVETPTGPMSWHDVRIALLHAQDVLLRAGITRATPAALQAALVGGEVDSPSQGRIVVRGVLQMRVEGLSWVDIARVTSPSAPQPAFLGR
jgi:hypothetical protein